MKELWVQKAFVDFWFVVFAVWVCGGGFVGFFCWFWLFGLLGVFKQKLEKPKMSMDTGDSKSGERADCITIPITPPFAHAFMKT